MGSEIGLGSEQSGRDDGGGTKRKVPRRMVVGEPESTETAEGENDSVVGNRSSGAKDGKRRRSKTAKGGKPRRG